MKRIAPFDGPIKLDGFNNLTKALSFNLYDFCIARDESEREAYRKYIQERFTADKVTKVLKGICTIIEANVLAVSDQDYDPWGASSLVLMSDIKGSGVESDASADVKMHLDKSHITAHTYPDFQDKGQICSFRIDIDIATCGEISPLNALNYMLEAFESDVVVCDYVVRGYTRDENGKRIYMDHKVQSIQDYIKPEIKDDYHCIDLALQSENIWQTKMIRTNMDVPSYFLTPVDLEAEETKKYVAKLKNEMSGVVFMLPD